MREFPTNTDKSAWRAWAKAKRRGIDYAPLQPVLFDQLATLPEWKRARHILLYLALPGEFPVEKITEYTAEETSWYLPRCARSKRLALYPYQPGKTTLIAGLYGLREPDPTESAEVSPELLDLVVVPALLFSEQGERLGYGGGYYDRFLPRLSPGCTLVGILAEQLVVPSLPVEPHDIGVDIIVTEKRTLRPASRKAPTPPLD